MGDGAWVFRSEGRYSCATWPFQGEFAGETVFLTSKNAGSHFQIATATRIDAIAGFTDGLERLALNMATREASPGFFDGMFRSLASMPVGETESNLKAFLGSKRVNERTDDDKTLVLTTHVEGDRL